MPYPSIQYPHRITTARQLDPPVPVLRARSPRQPQRISRAYTILETGILLMFTYILWILTDPLLTIGICLIGAVATGIHMGWQWRSFPRRQQDHTQKLRLYQQAKAQHEAKVRQIRSPEGIRQYQHQALLQAFSNSDPPDTDGQGRRGGSEEKFEIKLRAAFPGKILKGRPGFAIPDFPYPYTPDMIYHDPALKLWIDIEIDEPYSWSTGEPIHYQGLDKQLRRDQFFLDKGWIVIRFAEEQVVRFPRSCCKVIALVLAELLEDGNYLDPYDQVPDLPQISQWTREEAEDMARRRTRDQLGP